MYPIKYYDIMRKSKDKKFLRYEMARYADEHGIKPAARTFNTTAKLYESGSRDGSLVLCKDWMN